MSINQDELQELLRPRTPSVEAAQPTTQLDPTQELLRPRQPPNQAAQNLEQALAPVESSITESDNAQPTPSEGDGVLGFLKEKGSEMAALTGAVQALLIGRTQQEIRRKRESGSPLETGQAILQEEMLRVPSALYENVGQLTSTLTGTRKENNPFYDTGRFLRLAAKTPDDLSAQEGLPEQFTRAFAQTAAFFTGGKTVSTLIGQGNKVAGMTAAWMGASVGGQAGAENARAHGAEPWQEDVAYYANATFGLSEGLPVAVGFQRLDDITGGAISRRMQSKAGEMSMAAIQGALTEGLQEAFQTFGENITARDIARYDPTRSRSENLLEAAAIGGTVGMTLSVLMTAMGIRQRTQRENEVLEATGANTLDEIAGPFVVLDQTYMRELSRQGISQDILNQNADPAAGVTTEFVGQEELEIGQEATGTPLEKIAINDETVTQRDELAELIPDTFQEIFSDPGNTELNRVNKVSESIERNQVTMAMTRELDFLRDMKKQMDGLIQDVETGVTNLEEISGGMEGLLVRQKSYEVAIDELTDLTKGLKSLTESLTGLLPEGTKIVLDDFTNDLVGSDSALGSYKPVKFTSLQGTTSIVDSIFVDLSTFSEEAAILGEELGQKEFQNRLDEVSLERSQTRLNNKKAEIFQAFLHEFGHAVAFNEFQSYYRKIRNGTATQDEKTVFEGLQRDYWNWVADNLNAPFREAVPRMFSLPRLHQQNEYFGLTTAASPLSSTAGKMGDYVKANQALTDGAIQTRSLNYLFSFREFLAEEFSKTALHGDKGILNREGNKYFEDVTQQIRKAVGKTQAMFGSQSPTITNFFRRWSSRERLTEIGKELNKQVTTNPFEALTQDTIITKAPIDGEPVDLRKLGEEMDRFNWFMDVGFNILQIAEQNPHLKGLQNYVKHLREWKNEVNNNLAVADSRLKEWRAIGRKEQEVLGRLLLDETVGRKHDGGWLKDPENFTPEEIAKYGLSDKALQLRADIKKDFANSLDQMEEVLVNAKKRIFSDPQEAAREIAKVQKEFRDMRAKPYFPLMRFGEYVLQARANGDQVIDGRKYKDGEQIEFQAFESKKDRSKALTEMRRRLPKGIASVSTSKMVAPNFSLQGMPLTLIEHLESKLTATELDEATKKIIQDLKNDALPFRSFRKQFQKRNRVAGYSMDAMRSYANYMTSFSNHIARVKFDHLFKKDFDNLENSIKVANKRDGANTDKRAGILNHMNNHMQYVMNPVNEFIGLRSATFFWFLGFNVKSAFVNLTQIPLVTYPYLASRYGDGKAVAALSRAYGTTTRLFTKPDDVDIEIKELVEKGLSESWLDESLATELALAASEKNLDQSLPRSFRQRASLKISHYGSLPFHVAEKLNRHVTAIAAFRLAKAKGRTKDDAFEDARKAVEKSQYEYARWARPRFMRGKVGGTIFVFQSYLQNTLYFALGGDPGALRMWAMLLLVAGLQGIPFGENVMDLYDAMISFIKKRTGAKDPHTQIRTDLRDLLKDMEVNPDLVMHGLSSSTFGLGNVGEFMGWPIPDLDLSGSLSLGRVVPGTELLRPGNDYSFEQITGQALERGGGATMSAAMGIGQAIFDKHPDQWKRWERAMPSAMRQISKAARFSQRGNEATRSNTIIAEFDETDPRDNAELLGQALGFTPRDVARGWEGYIAKQQSIIYYESWKTRLLARWNRSKLLRDEEAVKGINAEIRAYNAAVPYPEMKVGFETRRRSYESYLRSRQFNEASVEQRRAFRRLSDSVESVFREAEEDN